MFACSDHVSSPRNNQKLFSWINIRSLRSFSVPTNHPIVTHKILIHLVNETPLLSQLSLALYWVILVPSLFYDPKTLTITNILVLRKAANSRNEQNKSKNEVAGVFRSVNSRNEQDSHVWVLVWLHKTKVRDKAKLCYTDTNSLIVYVQFEDVYADIAGYNEKRFDKSIYEAERQLPLYSYLTDNVTLKRGRNTGKKCVIKQQIKLQDYKSCIKINKAFLTTQ